VTAMEKALLLIDSTQRALARGVRHYNRAGRLLTTPFEILSCLKEEGAVQLEDPEPREGAAP
jgi:hypothetical protein